MDPFQPLQRNCDEPPAFVDPAAGGSGSERITLLGNLALSGEASDVWGYFDETTGKEYAIVGFIGNVTGIHIVDVSDPTNPLQVAIMDSIPGFDVKIWRNYVYTVTGSPIDSGAIVDISNPAAPAVVGAFPSSHNIFIDQYGYMYSEEPGLRIFSLSDPLNPALIWRSGNAGHDAAVICNRLYDFHGFVATNIYDVTNPEIPQLLGTIGESPMLQFHHSGWPSEDGNYLFICDELGANSNSRPDITVWDISDLSNPQFITSFNDENARVHNLYVIGDYAYVSYYAAGFRVFRISDPTQLIVVDEFDTSPSVVGREALDGAFGVYPFTRSGNIYVSDLETGLFIFSFNR